MKKLYTLLALLGTAVAASAMAPKVQEINLVQPANPVMELIASGVKSRSLEMPESEFTGTKARFYYYDNYYKNDTTSCYQLVFTNSEAFSSGGTVPAAPGQLICAFLCGPRSADKDNPVLPAGSYKFAAVAGDIYTFGSRYGHYIDAFEYNGELAGWQLPLAGGTIDITETDGIYDVVAHVTAAEYDEETDEEFSVEVSATYHGAINVPGPLPELPGEEVYEMNIPNLSGMYDSSQHAFILSFYGCELDGDGFIVGRGDLMNATIYYDGETPQADLPGTYEYVAYTDYANWSNDHFVGGYLYKLSADFIIPMGTYCAVYNEYGSIESCGVCDGGTITVTALDEAGNMKFDFDLTTQKGPKAVGSWSGNIREYVLGLEDVSGISAIGSDRVVINGLEGHIEAPAAAKVYNMNGLAVGKDNLQRGIYIVVYNGTATKVAVK